MLISSLILAFLTLIAVSLQKTYASVPVAELKRRARKGDEIADLLFRAAAYGASLLAFMWIITGLTAAGFFVLVSRSTPGWFALLVSLVLLWLGFAWLPNTGHTKTGNVLARVFTPPLTWLLGHLYPLIGRITNWFESRGKISVHTGLYEKEDLIQLIKNQKQQKDNRIPDGELAIAANALSFGDRTIGEIMTPQRMAKAVAATESVGPVLMDELHDSGHSRFPVYQDKQDNVVGILYLRDLLTADSGGRVRDLMDKKVYYVHEEQPLGHALTAFLKTKHHLFIVVNTFEEVSGIVTIEDILEQILGKPIVDEFDKYDDLREVAKLHAKKAHAQNIHQNPDHK